MTIKGYIYIINGRAEFELRLLWHQSLAIIHNIATDAAILVF